MKFFLHLTIVYIEKALYLCGGFDKTPSDLCAD